MICESEKLTAMKREFSMRHALAAVVLVASLGLAGCDNNNTFTAPTDTSTTITVSFSTNLAVGGASTRSFDVARAGTVSATLLRVGTTDTLSVGLGIGIPLEDGSGCVLSRSVVTTSGTTAQLELAVDIGTYCLQIYDPGTLSSVQSFTISLIYPK